MAQTPVVKTYTTPADSYVSSSSPEANYGIATSLKMKASGPIARTYVRFVVSGLTAPVSKATLRLYSLTTSSSPIEVRPAPGDWLETGIKYSNAPVIGPVAAKSGALTSGKWVSIDVTKLIPDNGTFSLALTTPSTAYLNVASRQRSASQAAQLIVETPPPPPPPPPARAYYVDAVEGNDSNDGTSAATAWKTLGKVNAVPLVAGEQVLFERGGIFPGTLSIQNNGTAAAPITIGAYGTGALPIIRGGSNLVTGGYSCVILAGSYVVVNGIQIDGCPWAGVAIKGGNNRVEDSTISGNAAGVVISPGSSTNAILRNRIVNNNKMSVLTQSPTNDDSGAFGILVEGDSNEIAFNTISGSDAFSYDYGRDGAAIEIYGGVGNNIHHNRATQNDVFTELGSSRAANNTFAYNMVRSTLTSSTFAVTRGATDVFGPVKGTKLLNNTVQMTGTSGQGFVCYAGCSAELLSMRNNIIDAAWKVGYADAAFDEANNLFATGQLQFTMSSLSLKAVPMFVNPLTGDLHLLAGSPAIDKGVLVGYSKDLDDKPVPMDGNADGKVLPDLGGYEVGGATAAAFASEPAPTSPAPAGPRPAPRPAPSPSPPTGPSPSPPPPGPVGSVVAPVTGKVDEVAGPLLGR